MKRPENPDIEKIGKVVGVCNCQCHCYLRDCLVDHDTGCECDSCLMNLKATLTLEKTLDDLEKGDKVISPEKLERFVIERVGRILFLSAHLDPDQYSFTTSIEDLKEEGYTLKSPTPPKVKVTMGEVAKAMNLKVGEFGVV